MPEIIVYAAAGRTSEQKKRLMERITSAVVEEFSVPKEAVVVQVMESALDHKMKGGVLFSDR
ncbi:MULTISPECIES: tautomerase family protein [Silvimonas]|uniref:Tautomerase n=2 Tax=Silvimonas TaxID=300264 RepID=A0ABQ2PB53_9NEIS|nr:MULTISPECIES: tautomerase family protein [Silvimonas]GGP22273.1 putative tautomerase [Silvimonas iriomotensis]GGP27062.1 putative tautomerase [Silvimonas amylolytica]